MIGKSMRWEGFSLKVNTGSRIVNTDSRKWGKVFTFSRNRCSRSTGMGVHVGQELVFSLPENMQVPHWLRVSALTGVCAPWLSSR